MWKTECGQSVTSEFNPNLRMSHDVGSITLDCESCQNEISALTTRINVVDFALGRVVGSCKSPP